MQALWLSSYSRGEDAGGLRIARRQGIASSKHFTREGNKEACQGVEIEIN